MFAISCAGKNKRGKGKLSLLQIRKSSTCLWPYLVLPSRPAPFSTLGAAIALGEFSPPPTPLLPPTYVLRRGRGIVWQLLPKNAKHQDLGYELFPCRPCLRGLLVTLFVCSYTSSKEYLNYLEKGNKSLEHELGNL